MEGEMTLLDCIKEFEKKIRPMIPDKFSLTIELSQTGTDVNLSCYTHGIDPEQNDE